MMDSWFGFTCIAAGIVIYLLSAAIGAMGPEKK